MIVDDSVAIVGKKFLYLIKFLEEALFLLAILMRICSGTMLTFSSARNNSYLSCHGKVLKIKLYAC
jgi:hypothetical protein